MPSTIKPALQRVWRLREEPQTKIACLILATPPYSKPMIAPSLHNKLRAPCLRRISKGYQGIFNFDIDFRVKSLQIPSEVNTLNEKPSPGGCPRADADGHRRRRRCRSYTGNHAKFAWKYGEDFSHISWSGTFHRHRGWEDCGCG